MLVTLKSGTRHLWDIFFIIIFNKTLIKNGIETLGLIQV